MALPSAKQIADLTEQVSALSTEKETLTAEVAGLKVKLEAETGKVTALTGERDQALQNVTVITQERDGLKTKLETTEKEKADAVSAREKAETDLKTADQRAETKLREEAAKNGNTPPGAKKAGAGDFTQDTNADAGKSPREKLASTIKVAGYGN